MKQVILLVGVLAVLAFGVRSFLAAEKEREERVQLKVLTDDLIGSRAEVNSCLRALSGRKRSSSISTPWWILFALRSMPSRVQNRAVYQRKCIKNT